MFLKILCYLISSRVFLIEKSIEFILNPYLRRVMTNWKNHLSSNPTILFGKLVIKDTRIPVELILEKLASNYSFQELLDAYPRLKTDDIKACLAYAAENSKHEKILAIG
jgi:uncharacterized protein (DUF433 family)